MKFKYKITLAMVCLLSLLFGLGGSALITISFSTSLEREKQAARDAYKMLLNTVQVINEIDKWTDEQAVSQTFQRLDTDGVINFSSMRLTKDGEDIYLYGDDAKNLPNISSGVDAEHNAIGIFNNKAGKNFFQLCGMVIVGNRDMYLDATYEITEIYSIMEQQKQIYSFVFVTLVAVCAILSLIISHFLTISLRKLSRASVELASGNLAYRSKLRSSDEIGLLSADFDNMAQKIETNIEDMKDMVRSRDEFMGSFAHELKTPMTSVIGYSDLIRSGTLSQEEQAQAANYIFSESKRLESLSLKLLDIFVIDKRNIVMKNSSPSNIVASIIKNLKPIYLQNGIELHFNCEKGECLLEPELVNTLIVNLIDNARKAIDGTGVIYLAVKMTADGCEISVQDTGRGIPQDSLDHLTEAFYRVDKSRSRRQGGAGLGLALCLKIIQLHNGDIRFVSKEGRGTKVIVELKGGHTQL